MFSFTQLKTIAFATVTGSLVLAGTSAETNAQQTEFDRRAEAMQRARSRYTQPADAEIEASASPRIAQASAQAPAAPSRTSGRAKSQSPRRSASGPSGRASGSGYRVAQAPSAGQRTRQSQSRQTSTPRVAQNLATGMVMDGYHGGETIVDGGYLDSSYSDETYYEGDGGGGCNSCGDSGGYFESGCSGDACCGRGGCPPGDCWLSGLGGILRNGEYFFGATGFQEPLYTDPTTGSDALIQDSNFGFYGGFNLGVPLCRLTCGVLSGQIGARSVQTNFSGNEFTNESRDQLFVTGGLYRRVDYGIQFGVVADFLQDEFYGDAGLSQIRADLGWVYAGGSSMGFRYAGAQEDDLIDGTFGGDAFTGQDVSVHDQYRFYYRAKGRSGGYGEAFAGWTEFNQTILGMDFDVPVSSFVAIESNFTYFFNDDGAQTLFPNRNFLGSNADEAWNISVGFVFRPQGRRYYNSYDRPMFDVADNGTMLTRRSR